MIEEKNIGFEEIKEEIKKLCNTLSAKDLVGKISFLNNYETINQLLQESYEMKSCLLGIRNFPSDNYFDCSDFLVNLRIEGSCIRQEDMKMFLLSYSTIEAILDFFYKEEQENSKIFALKEIYNKVFFSKEVLQECSRIIDEDGEIKESCSPLLREIRQRQQRCQNQITRKIQNILSDAKNNGWTATEEDVTIRNNSLVIPVKSSYKKQVKGILHDSSQSGQTFYIEPSEIVELNFEAKELFLEEQREIQRILLEFSNLIRDNLEEILSCYKFLINIDFIRAKALYSINIRAGKPDLKPYPLLNWFEARHPLLEHSLKKKQKSIVPLRISLDKERRILIISGPNAGGKSVCLKTVALLQYMIQCGLLVPMKETSQVGVFHDMFISIGDAQSIENDLSTYSSHLLKMKEICEQADNDTLFLIDELGTGTDPNIGGAIAESVLEYLNNIKSWGIVTTHYSNLKHLATKYPSIINGAMLYDSEKMLPLFILSIGMPGSSFAFEIAQRIGLPKSIVENAKQKIGSSQVNFEQELQQIEVEKLALEEEKQRMKAYDEELYEIIKKHKSLEEKLNISKRDILNQARQEAKEILQNANSRIEKTIEEIKTSKANKEKVKQLKEEITKEVTQLQEDIKKEEKNLSKLNANDKLKNSH
ncbi:MAG: endonuclease MutS2, partial [Bacteroidota bacterium]|nr:endonuclease MutS2 [Bacteroidota bacterium]